MGTLACKSLWFHHIDKPTWIDVALYCQLIYYPVTLGDVKGLEEKMRGYCVCCVWRVLNCHSHAELVGLTKGNVVWRDLQARGVCSWQEIFELSSISRQEIWAFTSISLLATPTITSDSSNITKTFCFALLNNLSINQFEVTTFIKATSNRRSRFIQIEDAYSCWHHYYLGKDLMWNNC